MFGYTICERPSESTYTSVPVRGGFHAFNGLLLRRRNLGLREGRGKVGRRRRRREVVHHLRGERVLVDLHRARRAEVVRGDGGRRSSRAARARTGRLGTRSRASGLLCRADQRRAVGGPQRACELDVVRARSSRLLLLAPRRTRLRSAGGTRLVAGRGLGREVPEGLPEDLEAGLDEGEGVGLHCGDAGVDVSLVLDEERLEVCLVDPSRALRWVVASRCRQCRVREIEGSRNKSLSARTCVCGSDRKRRKTVRTSQ